MEGFEFLDVFGFDDKKDGDLDIDELFKGEGGVEYMECEIKLEGFVSFDVEFGKEEIEESKKCKCKLYWFGIGGFMV